MGLGYSFADAEDESPDPKRFRVLPYICDWPTDDDPVFVNKETSTHCLHPSRREPS